MYLSNIHRLLFNDVINLTYYDTKIDSVFCNEYFYTRFIAVGVGGGDGFFHIITL
jgi:hypothetical protein